jgi:hypothetical protein
MARRIAARRTLDALGLFEELSRVHKEAVDGACEVFHRRHGDAKAAIARLDPGPHGADGDGEHHDEHHRRMADALARVAAGEALSDLTEVGLLPEAVARDATRAVSPDSRS